MMMMLILDFGSSRSSSGRTTAATFYFGPIVLKALPSDASCMSFALSQKPAW